ncbi:MAG: cytochrome c biogenesis protein ResB [Planctomycetota bacterium]
MKDKPNPVVRLLGSYGLCITLLLLLLILTFAGTWYQVEAGLFQAQKRYFESWGLIQHLGPLRIPLPGGMLVMGLLAVNLLFGGFVRIRKSARTAGVLIVHTGIAMLLLAGIVKQQMSDDGGVMLFEGESATHYQDHYHWEVAVRELEPVPSSGMLRSTGEWVVGEESFRKATADAPARLKAEGMPFDIWVRGYAANSQVMPKGPMWNSPFPVVEGFAIRAMEKSDQAEANFPALYAEITPAGSTSEVGGMPVLLWGMANAPAMYSIGGRSYAIDVRKKRYPMPFELKLIKFTKEDHPRTRMARVFSSHVEKITEGGESIPVHIQMNEPLRSGGVTVFQSSWGPENARPNTPLFSGSPWSAILPTNGRSGVAG